MAKYMSFSLHGKSNIVDHENQLVFIDSFHF